LYTNHVIYSIVEEYFDLYTMECIVIVVSSRYCSISKASDCPPCYRYDISITHVLLDYLHLRSFPRKTATDDMNKKSSAKEQYLPLSP